MNSKKSVVTLGLAVGKGTGRDLSEIFIRVVDLFKRLYNVKIDVEPSPKQYESFHSLGRITDTNEVIRITEEDSEHYFQYCLEMAQKSAPAIFRTAINAQALYLVREKLCAVKVEQLINDETDILLVRDQAQGFYSGFNTLDNNPLEINRICRFSHEITTSIFDFALKESVRYWGDTPIDRIIVAYKFHLLDNRFKKWVDDYMKSNGLKMEICQPDTVNRNILHDGLKDRVLIIGSNEWADIMHSMLLSYMGLGSQENRYTYNAFLNKQMNGLIEYQTVHGSADDLEGKNIVNPFATVCAAAAIVEHHAGCKGAYAITEKGINQAIQNGIVTPDLGGESFTDNVVNYLLKTIENKFNPDAYEKQDLSTLYS